VESGPAPPADLPDPLTQRELTVLRLLATSMSITEIADELCLSVNTVKTHLAAIYRKLPASRRRDAVLRARQLELM
jgi:LuxR family maltose regulon positive regulatory protein